jgi:hypothetical protein
LRSSDCNAPHAGDIQWNYFADWRVKPDQSPSVVVTNIAGILEKQGFKVHYNPQYGGSLYATIGSNDARCITWGRSGRL